MPRVSDRELSRLAHLFKRKRKPVWDYERHLYSGVKNLSEAIDASLGLRPGDRIPDHQRRVGRVALSLARQHLRRRARSLATARDFAELHRVVEQVSRQVPRFGRLATYDVAERLGIFLGKKPELVYLHAGTKEGASALGVSGDVAKLTDFPKSLQIMSPDELEDFLCICKSVLRGRVSYSRACQSIRTSCSGHDPIC